MKKGDHLVSPRTGYDHHGLYIGNEEVIHYSGFSEFYDKGSIEITSLENFKQGNGCKLTKHLVSIYSSEERVERAFSKLGEDSYNIVFNNCEHFVNWCFNGFKSSSQVNSVVNTATFATNEYMKRKGTETVISAIAQNVTKNASIKTAEHALVSVVAKSTVSTVTSTAAGFTAASAVTGATATGVVSAFAAGSIATVAAPVAVAVGVGYGVKKAFDWLFD